MSITSNFDSTYVLCLGDVMLDRFVTGAVRRISPESPIPVLSMVDEDVLAGGAANVARNIAALGGHCTLIGVVGEDEAYSRLERVITSRPGVDPVFVSCADRPTSEKIRFVAQGQHMLRVDREVSSPIPTSVEDKILAEVARRIGDHHVLVLSDYAKGVLTDRVIFEAIALARKTKIPVVVDPKSTRFARYDGATILTPNAHEAFAGSGIDPKDDESTQAAGEKILSEARIEALLITRAEKGMSLIRRDASPDHIPSKAVEVADVVGAGDTVVATLALTLGSGADLNEAAMIANVAAGIVVGKRGTASVSLTELSSALESQIHDGLIPSSLKVLSLDQASGTVQGWKRDGLKVGFTNGCFDILHVGHMGILEFSRGNCDRLVVGINTDASVRRLKGASRPINPDLDRARLIAGLGVVDAVVLFDADTPADLIAKLEPDVLVKGADYQVSDIVGAHDVLARGGKVLRFELVPGRSTTSTIRKAQGDMQGDMEVRT